jgi:hypothetical protein
LCQRRSKFHPPPTRGEERERARIDHAVRVDAISTPCERNVRDRLFSFYLWCAGHDDIPS